MSEVRTVDFLPPIFQTPVNRQFFNATLDQLIQEPKFQKTQGYVGRKIGAGVNANDKYVIEPTKTRTDYQLEPGVVSLNPSNKEIDDIITYPGILDGLKEQGASVDNADRLFASDFYTWDPFVDFDKLVNYSQYYWLPEGPDEVDVFGETVPLTDTFVVTRENGVYTFSGKSGSNPTLTLVRTGSYNFEVAQNGKETVNFRVQNKKTQAYVIDYENNPTLTLVRGNTYVFNMLLDGNFPLYIKTQPTLGTTNLYNNGVAGNGSAEGQIVFTVPQDAPDTLWYVSSTQFNMRGQMNVIDAIPGTGPGFWIQTDPGVNGKIPATPNISSRDVLGVINNGEDLGTVTFNVPESTAQAFYYGLDPIGNIPGKPAGTVDLVTTLKFNEINNIFLEPFFAANPNGIDGVKELDGKTIVFLERQGNAEAGGWQITSQFDPLVRTVPPTVSTTISYDVDGQPYDSVPYETLSTVTVGVPDPADGLPGSYDSLPFDYTQDITSQETRYSVWQIRYRVSSGGQTYMTLSSVLPVNNLQKFNILFGTQYASTGWYKDATGYFEQIPLLSAIRDVLYYQDGADPEIFGTIRLINREQISTIFISDILGQKNYTSPNGVVFTNGLKVTFRGDVEPVSYQNQTYYIEGVGTAIKLLPVGDFVTPERYTESASVPYDSLPYDVGNFDATLNAPLVQDYLTINRASPDLNAWTRSNRWFHIDVIYATATYNNTIAVIDNANRAKRPILEFRAGTRLFHFGTEGKQPVNVIDFTVTDALSTINGSTGYSIDGYNLVNGTRIIFAADSDPQVRNKIYEVEFIIPDTVPPLIAQPIINLVPASDATVLVNQSTVCISGTSQQGKSFYFDGLDWLPAQEKTKVNQPPLFDIFDSDGISLSNVEKYPGTNFNGTKLFSYATSNLAPDVILGFPIRYLSLENVGDILFDNNLYADTFSYVIDSVGQTSPISIGFVRQYSNRVEFTKELGWQPAATRSIARQQFQFTYTGSPLKLDIPVVENNLVPAVQIYVNDVFLTNDKYSYQVINGETTITFNVVLLPDDIIEVAVLSNQISRQGFYQIPINLENNPFNANSPTFTLGTVRNHYESIGENLLNLQGPIIGANNSRDLGNLIPFGQQILQQGSPLTLAGFFIRNPDYNIFAALDYNSREYIKFKNLLLDTVIRNDYGDMTVSQMVDAAIADINKGKTDINSFYWSDMLPTGSVFSETNTTITPITEPVFNLSTTYNFTSANFSAVLVYLTRTVDRVQTITQLVKGQDYEVSTDGPTLTVLTPLQTGDVVTIREYSNTAGNFVPNTPTKMGLYAKYVPRIFYDINYVNPTFVIQGHDGSITTTFGDIRDQVLLEFERRIYNNLKWDDNPVPLQVQDVIPGFFRTTDYSLNEVQDILNESFLTWVGGNKLNYKQQDYIANNAFTWNYSSSGNKINNALLPGAWRGISRYFYDTLAPNLTPWEMLGLSEKPTWWEDRYGPAPYTSDNLVLWDDLEAGVVADPIAPYIKPAFIRPDLTDVIPTGTEGQLLPPIDSVVGNYDSLTFQKSWVAGDGGPTEASWWNSSSYPFAVMRLLALTRPAEFFSLFADRDLYKFDFELDQYLYNGRYRLDANGIQIYGNGTSKASYINWIVDYNKQLGRDTTQELTERLANLDVRLCYRMASFTNKQYAKIFIERSGPDSTNSGLLFPDDSYNLILYKNQPFASVAYSSLMVERTNDGYAIYGYDNQQPYFSILASASAGVLQTVSAGGVEVRVPTQYTDQVVNVPYGYVFTNATMMVDFILSYGAYLQSQGLIFDDRENNYTLNWNQMAQEFLYFSAQGWGPGTVINLNPMANTLKAFRAGAIIDSIESTSPENQVVDQNGFTLPTRNLIVERQGNGFSITSPGSQAISYLKLKFTSYEHMIVLDNRSIFNDLVYDPTTGQRQLRIRITASTTTDWIGQVDAPGFILNEDNVKQWAPNRRYAKGEIVIYKNNYWSAQTIVQPKREFDYNDWVISDYTIFQQGLLPNLANKADQLSNVYNNQTANLERDNDLFSYGLIGFRPREYMNALNLDDVSQVNLYQQFIPTKGTVRAAEIFTRADLGKESGEYQIYENWAVLASTYGANANRRFVEFRLNEADLKSDPCTIQVIEPDQTSQANQTILLENLWRSSVKLTNTDIFPTTYESDADTALPSAGYVNLDDVDITVFSLDDPAAIAEKIDTIGVGTTIWAAKSNSYDWNVYRCSSVPGRIVQVTDNLDGTSILQFTTNHGLVRGDILILRFFNDLVNGVYRVINVPSITTLTVAYRFNNSNQSSITGNGLALRLDSIRVPQASDLVNKSYSNLLIPGALAYVDNNGQGHWQVLQKQNPFEAYAELLIDPVSVNSRFGTSIGQTQNRFAALVGAPGLGTDAGSVITYFENTNDLSYEENVILTLDATNIAGFGSSIAVGNNNWIAIGAPRSNSNCGYVGIVFKDFPGGYAITQFLLPPDQDFSSRRFGSALAISQNERWMYISSPEVNKVYAYGRVDIETQSVTYIGDGDTFNFNWSDHMVVNSTQPAQIVVSRNGIELQPIVDYSVNAVNVVFNETPLPGSVIRLTRRQGVQLDRFFYGEVAQTSTTGGGSGATFNVIVTRGDYNVVLVDGGDSYNIGDQLTISGTDIGGASPANNITITVSAEDGGTITDFTYTGSGISGTTNFALDTYLYTATSFDSFTVIVNGVYQRPHIDFEFNNDSTANTADLDFITVPPPGATIIVTSETYWQYCDTIVVPSANAGAGTSISTTTDGRQVLIGAPYDNALDANLAVVPRAGAVYNYDRSVIGIIVTDTANLTYTIPGTPVGPINVFVNGVYQNVYELTQNSISIVQFLQGTVSIDLDANTITFQANAGLVVGDRIEIETNQFTNIQKITADTPLDESAFGYSVDVCNTNCSLYIGAPLDSTLFNQAGAVQRDINQARLYGTITALNANPNLTPGDTIRINNVPVPVPNAPNNTVAGLVEAINDLLTTKYYVPNVVASSTANLELRGNNSKTVFDVGNIYSAAQSYNPVVYLDDVLLTSGVDYVYNNNTQQITFTSAPPGNALVTVVSGRLVLTVKNALASEQFSKLSVLPGVAGTAFTDLGFETFVYTQTITSPNPVVGANFGHSVNIDSSSVNLVVGAPKGNIYKPMVFDNGTTFFDDRSTTFSDTTYNSGVVYTFDLLSSASGSAANPSKFVFGQQLFSNSVLTADEFGSAVSYVGGRLMAGAPTNDINETDTNYGIVAVFDNPNREPAWKVLHQQQPVVNVHLLNTVYMYDRLLSSTATYFDFFDPLQGKILGAARRNLDYIGAVDPAFYNQGTVRNNGNSWGEEHVGQMWWDTTNARFIDPNQDDIVYASRRWGQLFPGSRIEVYQWISSTVSPVEYVGPGTPLSTTSFTIRSALNKDNVFTTTYYFWVRDIATIDNAAGKTLSSLGVSRYIENPRASGIPYIAALNSNTVAIYNGLDLISAADTILHVGYDQTLNDDNIHQEFQLIADGRPEAFLNATLYRKLQDSLCGVNEAGAVVPDPFLSPAERYGVQFRPRQSMFVNRFGALKNYLERANRILKLYPIVETRRLSLLNSSEPEPTVSSGAWNQRLENLDQLSYQDLNVVPLGYKYLVASTSTQNGRWTIYEVTLVPGTAGLRTTTLIRVQNYDTKLYWYHIDWYMPGYNSTIQPVAEVPNFSALGTLNLNNVPLGSSVKVTANAQGKFEIYIRTLTGWDRVGLQDGTIQFREELWNYIAGNFGFDVEVFDAQYFDQEPVIETRKIIQAINEELFIDDLAIERNQGLMLLFNYIYSENGAPEWLLKTSLVDVDHKIRALLPYQNYLQDNQNFVLNYIQEVKPYHVQIREFNLSYFGEDLYPGDVLDYDLPAYWDTLNVVVPQYVSPILTPYTQSNSTIENTNSDAAPDAQIWTLSPWKQWFENYQLSLTSIVIVNGGDGYTQPPVVTCEGAELVALINSAGRVVAVEILSSSLYLATPVVTISGGGLPENAIEFEPGRSIEAGQFLITPQNKYYLAETGGFLSDQPPTFNAGTQVNGTVTLTYVGRNALATATLSNSLVRSIRTTIKYDRYQYQTDIVEWQPNVNYDNGTQVRYLDQVWQADSTDSTGVQSPTFDPQQWTRVSAGTLTGVDRTMGFYVATANQPGLDLPLLIDGIDYPGVQVFGLDFSSNTGFDVGNYDTTPFDNISFGPEGRPTYDPALLDAIYESNYLDIYLGTRPTDVNVDGGEYVDTYESHAPEELVPGIEFDTLDLRVYTRPGSDWLLDGHGFVQQSASQVYDPSAPAISFANVVPYPATITVSNVSSGADLANGVNYTVDWPNQTVTPINQVNPGDVVLINVYEPGGGNQLFKQTYLGSEIGSAVVVPVAYDQILEFAIFVNGQILPVDLNDSTVNYSWESFGFNQTEITFTSAFNPTDWVAIFAIGPTIVDIDQPAIDYGWSAPVVQEITADGSLIYPITASLEYTNPDSLIVTVDGVRARTGAGIRYTADGSTGYLLPERLGFSQSLIADNEVHVYVNDIPQILGVDFTVDAWVGIPRSVLFAEEPEIGSQILIYVITNAQAYVDSGQLVFNPIGGLVPFDGQTILVTTWNDTRQQGILTQVIVGPITTGAVVTQPYDSTDFDSPSSLDPLETLPGQFDYTVGVTITINDINTEGVITDPSRLIVSLNGRHLFAGTDFTVNGTEIVLPETLQPTDVVMITQFTNSIVPESMAFRIFQDMRGVQATYRITPETTTQVAQPVLATDDIIYVDNASALGQPALNNNIWGVCTIDGERIMYRYRDTVNNTISSLLRGTAGTAAADHAVGAEVYDLGRGNLMPEQFQNYIVSNSFLADGSTTTFTADNIDVDMLDSTTLQEAVEVYVGGERQVGNYSITLDNPVVVEFDTPPPDGVEVTILVRRGVNWYQPGIDTPSDGVPLQLTDTQAARFLRGL